MKRSSPTAARLRKRRRVVESSASEGGAAETPTSVVGLVNLPCSGFASIGAAPCAAAEDDAAAQRATFRQACEGLAGVHIKAINGPFVGEGALVFYAKCRDHSDCPVRYRASVGGGQLALSAKGCHNSEVAVARRDAAWPISQTALAAVKEAVRRVGPARAVPEEIHEDLQGTAGEFAPGEAVRNAVKRLRRTSKQNCTANAATVPCGDRQPSAACAKWTPHHLAQ